MDPQLIDERLMPGNAGTRKADVKHRAFLRFDLTLARGRSSPGRERLAKARPVLNSALERTNVEVLAALEDAMRRVAGARRTRAREVCTRVQ
jgi:hypothetical protein